LIPDGINRGATLSSSPPPPVPPLRSVVQGRWEMLPKAISNIAGEVKAKRGKYNNP